MEIQKILITDDHIFTIEGIIVILNEKFKVDQFTLAKSPDEALKLVKKERFNLYILDLGFRSVKKSNVDIRELSYIRTIGKLDPKAKIIVFTMREDFGLVTILQKIKQVKAIVFKGPQKEYLQEAVTTVMDGGTYLCPRFITLNEKCEQFRKQTGKKIEDLSLLTRELKVKTLELLAKGYVSKQIADITGKSEETIKSYRRDLKKVFHAETPNDLLFLALLLNYINLDDLAEDLLDRLD